MRILSYLITKPEHKKFLNNTNLIYPSIIVIMLFVCVSFIAAGSMEERLLNPETRKEAIKELWDAKENAAPQLKTMLKHENREIREIALVRIINLKTNEFVTDAIEILNKTDEIKIKKRAIQYFCVIKEKSVIPVLQNITKESAEKKEKLYVIQAMGYIVSNEDKEYEGVKNTLKELLKDSDGEIRMESAYQLARLEDDSGYIVAEQDINNINPLARERAVEVLGEYGNPESLPLIEKALADKEIWVRTKAKIAKEKVELLVSMTPDISSKSPVKERRINRKTMLANKTIVNQKIAKLRDVLNSGKIIDVKIWAANEMLNMGEEGERAAKEIIEKSEEGAYVMGKEMAGRKRGGK